MRKKRYPNLSRAGQVMLEYIVVTGMLVGAVAILAVFLYTFREEAGRIFQLASSEYP